MTALVENLLVIPFASSLEQTPILLLRLSWDLGLAAWKEVSLLLLLVLAA